MADPVITVKWKKVPDEHDYPAAADYLEMLAEPAVIDAVIQELRDAPVVHKKAKDLLRASQLDALPTSNPYVRRDLQKIVAGKALSPILVVRGDFRKNAPMVIADGYHRVCAIYYTDENIAIPVKIASLP
ncbi:hypothetical protein NS506_00521 [Nocardia seriolae]|uniref:ParB/Sulfiredoxin domain-containing protein n=1 Tax=Nocardia seriolae TaxID=37332 RepID=A0ABC9Z0Y4_9NOCA|nr:hypothetical protein NS506_00521 [Nocardia seriolae]GEM26736.1 hypothetical protein NS2_49750 [Nocardia seriolae NBRC 15557]BEK91961.1 hypothetical protein NSERKGN1266_79120 [Nocardia seriolae]BEK99217.1 hypothetical protein NSER024013_71230 [Nocardia seriolae]GAM49202.1 hypothetical protein NS07_v2contig00100-0015 [Nocardia seriolae]